ncbi:MAG: endopeptidase La [Oscillospiraceae bacterium]|nr:endopeptidase La [Oscillospiraceae bacterium]
MSETKTAAGTVMPVLPMNGLVLFPNVTLHFDISKKISVDTVEAAFADKKRLFLTAVKDGADTADVENLYKVGVVAEVKQVLRLPENSMRVLVSGLYRGKIREFIQTEPFIAAEIKRFPFSTRNRPDGIELDALVRSIKESFSEYCGKMPKLPSDLLNVVMNETDPSVIFDAIAFNIPLSTEDKQMLLEASGITERLSMLTALLSRELEVIDLERHIQEQVKAQIDKGQRDYYLREQMKVISDQLGEGDDTQDEAYGYLDLIESLDLPEDVEEHFTREVDRLMKVPGSSQEAFVIRNYLDTCLELPWNKVTKDKTDIKKAREILDKEHYGLSKVKERILETIAVRALSKDIKGQIICLVGPPGIGKTSIGKSIAKALGRKYARVSLGGIKDESDIRGHRKTYIGSMPGRIITAMKNAGTKNPLILLDEIDKMSNDFRGDPSSAMLEVLDSEQNTEFRDHYIEVPFDLSDVLFVTTANTTQTIAPPLLDRMEVIELTSYTREEKFHIAKEHLVAKQLKKNGLKASMLKFTDAALYLLIDSYTKEAGVRNLERVIASICRKAAKDIVEDGVKKITVKPETVEKYLGAHKFIDDDVSGKSEVGLVNGLAWTSVGGVVMPLEVLVMDGKGTIETTGSLGDVMKESAKIAVSYVRSIADKYGISKEFYKEKDLHIHAPEGATPKDGPSAGVTMTTALVSALSGIPVRGDVAMTGEITLHGKVLPIGGLREKTMAAYKAGLKTVIVPSANKPDLEEVDDVVKESLKFIFAEKISDVLDNALEIEKPTVASYKPKTGRGRRRATV